MPDTHIAPVLRSSYIAVAQIPNSQLEDSNLLLRNIPERMAPIHSSHHNNPTIPRQAPIHIPAPTSSHTTGQAPTYRSGTEPIPSHNRTATSSLHRYIPNVRRCNKVGSHLPLPA